MGAEMNTLFQALGILFVMWILLELIPFGKRTRGAARIARKGR